MKEALTTLTTFETSTEAELYCAELTAAGIRACVADGMVADSLWQISPATGGAKLQVATEDFERALELLDSLRNGAGSDRPWRCGPCNEVIDPQFALCWSCGGLREEVEASPDTAATALPRDGERPVAEADLSYGTPEQLSKLPRPTPEQAANPYVASLTGLPASERRDGDEPVEESSSQTEEVDAMVRRGYVAAVLGTLVCPPLLHLYSLSILLPIVLGAHTLGRTSRRRIYIALAIDVIVVAICLLLLFGGM